MFLTFHELRTKNLLRCMKWHKSKKADVPGWMLGGWSLSDWMTATAGELGEAANNIKKLNRVRDGMTGNKGKTEVELRDDLASEFADVVIYLDLMAQAAGIELEAAIMQKFNAKSVENGFPEKLEGSEVKGW